MKRLLLYGIALVLVAALGWMPFSPSDVADLKPVELIFLDASRETVLVKTDTGESGRGSSLAAAIADMKKTTPGDVFLETADHLLITAEGSRYLEQAVQFLRPGCNVCLTQTEPDLEAAAAYLRAHEPGVTLQHWRAGLRMLPQLEIKEGRLCLVE